MTVMGLVAGVPWTWKRNGGDYLSVVVGVLVEVDDRQEVRSYPSLIAGPDVKCLVGPGMIVIVTAVGGLGRNNG
jgi:hypothetical protein